MFRDEQHPDVPLRDWETFRNECSPYVIEKVLDRREVFFPDWFVPLARGAAVASSYLLGRARYREGSHRKRGWEKTPWGFCKVIDEDYLTVAQYGPFWLIQRDGPLSQPPNLRFNLTLAYLFGATPILVQNYQSATYLAEYSVMDGLPGTLCWAQTCPDNVEEAVEFAIKRSINEATDERSLRYALLSWTLRKLSFPKNKARLQR
jgi:hypothetical protein